jgi:hypothetical protein
MGRNDLILSHPIEFRTQWAAPKSKPECELARVYRKHPRTKGKKPRVPGLRVPICPSTGQSNRHEARGSAIGAAGGDGSSFVVVLTQRRSEKRSRGAIPASIWILVLATVLPVTVGREMA